LIKFIVEYHLKWGIGMDNITYNEFQKAKKDKDLIGMQKIYRLNKNDLIIIFEYAKLLILNGYKREGRELLQSLIGTKNEKYAMLELGRLEASVGNAEKARKCFETLVKTRNDAYAMLELGRLEASVGNVEKARKCFETLLNTPNKFYAMLELGRLEASVGNVEKARKCFETLLNTPNKFYAKLEQGRLEASVGNVEKARKCFETLVKNRNDAFAMSELVLLEYKEKNYLQSFELINKALKEKFDISSYIIIAICMELNIFFSQIDFKKLNYPYSVKQLINYDYDMAIDHIIKRHASINGKSVFNKQIDVNDLFDNVKDKLIDQNKINLLNFNDVYVIPYENIGQNGENYLMVITLPHTKNVLSMYPVFSKYGFEDVDDEKELIKK